MASSSPSRCARSGSVAASEIMVALLLLKAWRLFLSKIEE
jgi:hypothetical protein